MNVTKSDTSTRTVLLVDDHPVMRGGLADLIEQQVDLTVCGEAEDPVSALKAIEDAHPDAVIVDIALRDGNGIKLTRDIKARHPRLAVLVLSLYDEVFYAERALRAGARGYITKAEEPARVIEGLRTVMDGNVFVSSSISSKMLSRMVSPDSAEGSVPLDRLTDREFEILELIGQGLQAREIAKRLGLSPKTIEAHREHIKSKLQLRSAAALARFAIRWAQFDRHS